jgi:signal transduction histidine kinase
LPAAESINLSAHPPPRGQQRLAAFIALLLLAGALGAIPFLHLQLPAVRPFIPIVDTILFLNDLITAALLFAQFSVVRSRGLLALACGYLYTALIIVPLGLSFPDVFSPSGLLGANLQSTVWLYIFWHLGLPPAVIAYVLLKQRQDAASVAPDAVRGVVVASIVAVVLLVSLLTWIVTAGAGILPPIMVDAAHASAVWHQFGAPPLLVLSVTSIGLLWWRRSSVLDLWLLVVLWAWFIETMLLSTTAYRYSFVWYAGRAFGLASSFFVMLVLLSESTLLYARLAVSVAARDRERQGRLMTMDALSASIAHEINQPLGAIVANGEAGLAMAEQDVNANAPEIRDVLRDIAADGRRAGQIVASMRSISRAGPPVRARIDVDEVISDAMTILGAELQAHGVSLRLALASRPTTVLADRGQIQQVVLNLATNAIDAMALPGGSGKTLTISSTIDDAGDVLVAIVDTGIGVDPDVADRVFDPFFTTKASGTGMGLAICRSLVASHGGRLWLSRDHTPGAAFHFVLPRQPDAV